MVDCNPDKIDNPNVIFDKRIKQHIPHDFTINRSQFEYRILVYKSICHSTRYVGNESLLLFAN